MIEPPFFALIDDERRPNITLRQYGWSRWRNPYHGVVNAVQRHALPEKGCVRAKSALPKSFADHNYGVAGRLVFALPEIAAHDGANPQQSEQRWADLITRELFRFPTPRKVVARLTEGPQLVEAPLLIAPRQVVQHRSCKPRQAQLIVSFSHPD